MNPLLPKACTLSFLPLASAKRRIPESLFLNHQSRFGESRAEALGYGLRFLSM